mmetsp:Transcript_22773/g.47426  ORF Transcript_22773/g.47426 Transcript_22773/m.47426 type:complete len:214 (-) Transcript_22773:148-789(-)
MPAQGAQEGQAGRSPVAQGYPALCERAGDCKLEAAAAAVPRRQPLEGNVSPPRHHEHGDGRCHELACAPIRGRRGVRGHGVDCGGVGQYECKRRASEEGGRGRASDSEGVHGEGQGLRSGTVRRPPRRRRGQRGRRAGGRDRAYQPLASGPGGEGAHRDPRAGEGLQTRAVLRPWGLCVHERLSFCTALGLSRLRALHRPGRSASKRALREAP